MVVSIRESEVINIGLIQYRRCFETSGLVDGWIRGWDDGVSPIRHPTSWWATHETSLVLPPSASRLEFVPVVGEALA